MLYIVEGPDAVGKTTFMEKLSKLTGFPIVKGSSFEIAALGVDGMFDYMKEQLSSNENLIVDRSFISNLVYGPMFDKDTLNYEQYKELLELASNKAITIYLTAPYKTVYNRLKERGDDQIKNEQLFDIMKEYEFIFYKLKGVNNNFKYLQLDTSLYHSNELAEMFWSVENNRKYKDDLNVVKSYIRIKFDRFNQFIFKFYAKLFK